MAANTVKVKAKIKDGSFWIILIAVVVYVLMILAFALQTMELVNWLMPTNLFMRVATVFSFDGCAALWAALKLFYKFNRVRSKTIVTGLWYTSFGLATIASIIQLYLSSTTRLDFTVDPGIISVAYVTVIVAMTVNIIALTFFLSMEYEAYHPSITVEEEEMQQETKELAGAF